MPYSLYRCSNPNFNDVLQGYPVGGEETQFSEIADGWSISHLVFFAVLGYLYPSHMYFVLFLGLLWESIEFATQHTEWGLLHALRGLAKCKNIHNDNFWWYGKVSDLLMNLLGFWIGMMIRKNII